MASFNDLNGVPLHAHEQLINGVLREECAVFEGVSLGVAPAAHPEVAPLARARAAASERPVVVMTDGEIEQVDVEVELGDPDDSRLELLSKALEILGAPVPPTLGTLHQVRAGPDADHAPELTAPQERVERLHIAAEAVVVRHHHVAPRARGRREDALDPA